MKANRVVIRIHRARILFMLLVVLVLASMDVSLAFRSGIGRGNLDPGTQQVVREMPGLGDWLTLK